MKATALNARLADTCAILAKKMAASLAPSELLCQALTHSSFAKKHEDNYERLEFLGDRVLGLVIADLLREHFPLEREGALAKRLSHLASEPILAEIGLEIGLENLILTETNLEPKNHPSILADVLEALVAVIYLEKGLPAAKTAVAHIYGKRIQCYQTVAKDPKSSLQEYAHSQGIAPPLYRILDQIGPDHAPQFKVEASLHTSNGPQFAIASNKSVRLAEKAAALELLIRLQAD